MYTWSEMQTPQTRKDIIFAWSVHTSRSTDNQKSPSSLCTCTRNQTRRHSRHTQIYILHLARDADTPDTIYFFLYYTGLLGVHWHPETSSEAVSIFTKMLTLQTLMLEFLHIQLTLQTPKKHWDVSIKEQTHPINLHTCTPNQTRRHPRHSEYRYSGPCHADTPDTARFKYCLEGTPQTLQCIDIA